MSTIRTERTRAYLERCIRNAQEDVDKARDSLRAAQLNRDEFELRERPIYPTVEMRLAIERAVKLVKEGDKPTSHLGRVLSDGVTVHGEQGFIRVDPQAPWGRAANGKLWSFTPSEVDIIRDQIKSAGLIVTKQWTGDGVSFVVEVAR